MSRSGETDSTDATLTRQRYTLTLKEHKEASAMFAVCVCPSSRNLGDVKLMKSLCLSFELVLYGFERRDMCQAHVLGKKKEKEKKKRAILCVLILLLVVVIRYFLNCPFSL